MITTISSSTSRDSSAAQAAILSPIVQKRESMAELPVPGRARQARRDAPHTPLCRPKRWGRGPRSFRRPREGSFLGAAVMDMLAD